MGLRRADAPEVVMETDREAKVAKIKEQLEQGDYRVDPKAVAEAILGRIRDGWRRPGLEAARPDLQSECSYPES
jgi:hypothetical protein